MKDNKIIINKGDLLLELTPFTCNTAYRTIGNSNIIVTLLINGDQYDKLLEYADINSAMVNRKKNPKKLLNIKYRIYQNWTSIVLLTRNNGIQTLSTIGNILYTDGPKYWDPQKTMKQYPAKMPMKKGGVLIYPEEEEIIFDYRPENIFQKSIIDDNVFSEPNEILEQEEREFYCAYHRGYAPIEEQVVSSRCKECQYKWDIIDEARQWARKRKLEFDLEWEVKDFIEIDDIEKEKSKNSTMVNPGKFTNLYQNAPTHCYFSGTKLEYNKAGTGYRASIARLDPDLGYTSDNCIVVSYAVSQLKKRYDWNAVINFFKNINQRSKNSLLQPDSFEVLETAHREKLKRLQRGAFDADKKGLKNIDIIRKDLSIGTIFTLVLDTDYICKITNSSMYITTHSLYMISIDRIDLDLSHSIDNIQMISWGANALKGDYFSTEEAKKFINETYKFYKEHHLIE